MERQIDKKETYLYGTLLALVREQLGAIQKQVSGRLGMWGKSRFNARTKEIQKIMFQIFQKKEGAFGEQAVPEMLADLDFIESDNRVWSDIKPEELQYLRNILSQLS